MASVRLTKQLKENICENLLKHTYQKKLEELIQKHSDFAQEIYDDIFDYKAKKLMASLPKKWLKQQNHIQVSFGGRSAYFYFKGNSQFRHTAKLLGIHYGCGSDETRLVPYFADNHKAAHYENNYPLADKFTELTNEFDDFHQEVVKAKSRLIATLDSFTTVGRLVKEWPEIEPFVPKHALISKNKYAVTVPVQDLNNKFNLPVEGQ